MRLLRHTPLRTAGRLDYNTESPYHYFNQRKGEKQPFQLNIDGHWVTIPWEVWYLQDSDQTCVQQTPPMFPVRCACL